MNLRPMRTKDRWLIIGSFMFVGFALTLIFWHAHRVDSAIYANLPDDPQVLITTMGNNDLVVSSLAKKKLVRRSDVGPLTSRLVDGDPGIRGQCVHALALIGNPISIPEIAKLEHDPDAWVRRWVAFALRQFNHHPEAKVVQERMKLDPDSSVRAEARADWF